MRIWAAATVANGCHWTHGARVRFGNLSSAFLTFICALCRLLWFRGIEVANHPSVMSQTFSPDFERCVQEACRNHSLSNGEFSIESETRTPTHRLCGRKIW